MEFKQLEAFVNVVKYKSFSKAAEATYLTQPTISTHISSLEKELGVKLVDRNGKESRPTKHGRAFYNYAINIINTRERAVNAMTELANEIAGAVDIKTSGIPGQFIVPEIIAGPSPASETGWTFSRSSYLTGRKYSKSRNEVIPIARR